MREDKQIPFREYIKFLRERGDYIIELEGCATYETQLRENYETFLRYKEK